MVYIGYMAALLVYGCEKPTDLSVFILIQAIIFFTLFKNFYNEHYRHPSKSVSTVKSTSKGSRK